MNANFVKIYKHPISVYFARFVIGIVFITSAVAKLLTLGQFEILILQQELIRDRYWAAYLARTLVAVELFIGISYFQPNYLRKLILPSSLVITLIFTVYLGYLAVFTDYSENCGCFGDLIKMTPVESILKNLLICALILYLIKLIKYRPKEKPLIPMVIAITIICALMLFYPVKLIGKSDIIVDTAIDKKTSLGTSGKKAVVKPSRFTIFNDENVTLTNGVCIAAFLSLDCDHCIEIALELGLLHQRLPFSMYYIFLGDEEKVPDFFSDTLAEFPYTIPRPVNFFDFIGDAPPRIYSLKEGQILAFWDLDNFSVQEVEDHLRTHHSVEQDKE